jgi:16S rRNA (guanine966-N2)-methyltransferase
MSGLRVIGGKARGRRLKSVPGDTTRPVTDRVKLSLFNILGADIEGASFLDLFAGTGSIGIEALSRGAVYVRFLDLNRRAVEIIQENLANTRLAEGSDVQRGDAFALLNRRPDRTFDYIYIAPPQYKGFWKQAIQDVDSHPGWLSDDAWVIVQIHPREYEQVDLLNLEEFEQRVYGSTLLVIYRRPED